MGDYSYFIERPVRDAAIKAGIDPQLLINEYATARKAGIFDDYKGKSADPDKADKDGMLRISFPHIRAMFKAGHQTDMMQAVGDAGKRPFSGYKGDDAVKPAGSPKGGGASGGASGGGGGGGGGGAGGQAQPGNPWDANNWTPYTPVSGFEQGFQPWDPISFSLDPSLQGTQPTFQPGGFMDPVPAMNPNVPAWPNFPDSVPPPNSHGGGGGGGNVNNAGRDSSEQRSGNANAPAPDRGDPYGPDPGGLQQRMDEVNYWWSPGQRGDQLAGMAGYPDPWGGGRQDTIYPFLQSGRNNADPIGEAWQMITDFFGQGGRPEDKMSHPGSWGAIGDSWGGGGGGGRVMAPDPWAFFY